MHYKIKQIKDIKNCDYSFEWWDWAKEKFSLNDYEVVYEGEIEGDNSNMILEELFEIFNIRHPEDFRGHSLSVSDVVELDGVNYYCDSAGWVKLEV
jgi:hypothetical protein